MVLPVWQSYSSTTTDGTDPSPTKPTGTAAGDLLLAFVSKHNSSATTITPPAGWVEILINSPTGGYVVGAWWKIAGASEPSSYTFVVGTGARAAAAVHRVTGADLNNPVNVYSVWSWTSPGWASTEIKATSVTTTVVDTLLVAALSLAGTASWADPSGMVERFAGDGSLHSASHYTQGHATAGATGDKNGTISPESYSARAGILVAIQEPQNAAPNAPTLTFPIDSEVVDRGSSQQFTWTFSDPDAGDLQSAYELRYRLVGSPSWTTVSGGATQSHTFVGGTFAAGDYEWQVRTTDNGGLVGPWSGSALFSAATAPVTPAIYDPVNNGTINSNPYLVKWTASAQDAFQVRTLEDNAGSPGTVIETSLIIEQPATRQFSMAFNTNNVVQHVQVRVRSGGLWSSWHSAKVNVSYTESQPGSLTATPEPDLGRIKLEFIPPTPLPGEPSIVYNDLTRKINGTVEYIAIARGLGQSFTYYDYNVSGDVVWEYQAISYADNQTTVYSVPVTASMQLKGSWIHFADDGPDTAIQFIYNDNAGDEDYEIQKSLFHTAGENEPFVEFGEGHSHSLTVRFFIESEQIPYFKILMRSGKILCYRDFYGRKVFCIPEASPIQRTKDGGWSTIKFTEVFYEEAL